MEHIKEITIQLLNSPILYLVSIAVLLILVKTGLLTIDSGPIKLGRTRDNERAVIAAQIAYITLHFDAIAQKMCLDKPHISPDRIKYVVGRLQDEMCRRISVNHISTNDVYENEVYLTLLDMTRKRSADPYYWSSEFEEFVRVETKTILATLVSIRNRLSKG